ncbi:hypothetical protein JCM12298_01410 [Desulfothermus naphthae]
MEVIFLGVGEACDEKYPNTSLLLYTGNQKTLLLDCGFSVTHEFFKYEKDVNKVDIIWISHFHGDHFLGLPLLLLRFWEQGRRRPLHFVGQKGIDYVVNSSMKLAFPTLADKISFDYIFHQLVEGEEKEIEEVKFSGASTGHTQPDLGVRISDGEKVLYYSGDGPPKEGCYEIAKGCDLLVQETFLLDEDIHGHGNFVNCIDFARKVGAKTFAPVHMQRDARDSIVSYFENNKDKFNDLNIIIPVHGNKITL